jgi:hypothetical protein
MDSSFTVTGRQLRSTWRDEEEDFISESIHYAQRNMTLHEYLLSAAHASHQLCVRTPLDEILGSLVAVGNDFFALADADDIKRITFFVLPVGKHTEAGSLIEIDVVEKTQSTISVSHLRKDKSFRAVLDDISAALLNTSLETVQGNEHMGIIELFSNFIAVRSAQVADNQLVQEGSTLIPVHSIISASYRVR